jgi:hypothetical protein
VDHEKAKEDQENHEDREDREDRDSDEVRVCGVVMSSLHGCIVAGYLTWRLG